MGYHSQGRRLMNSNIQYYPDTVDKLTVTFCHTGYSLKVYVIKINNTIDVIYFNIFSLLNLFETRLISNCLFNTWNSTYPKLTSSFHQIFSAHHFLHVGDRYSILPVAQVKNLGISLYFTPISNVSRNSVGSTFKLYLEVDNFSSSPLLVECSRAPSVLVRVIAIASYLVSLSMLLHLQSQPPTELPEGNS